MLDPLITKTIGAGMALLFLSAAWHKFNSLHRFEASLQDYRLLPGWLIKPASVFLPSLEAGLGILWLASWSISLVAPISAILLTIYTFAIAINVLRGRVHIDCGCGTAGGESAQQPVSIGLVIRNCVLAAFALMPALPTRDRDFGFADYVIIAASLGAAFFLYAAVTQLMVNTGVIRSWRQNRG